ncbi:hypothetical protein Q4494_04295 [Celeribacter halophilus]|uniref:5-methylcytosine-specific restriction enzyme subunit McrC n=1 Tax=Celeribacter halophilus TaxID=576117 RepID=A0AAW7XSL0_9RHOB|nr:hypothetical protein [Celeribacter halophilus]MDO6456288.1 hypothetical protein [Celeribacter halophilus]
MTIHYANEGSLTWLDGLAPSSFPPKLPSGVQLVFSGDRLGLRCDGFVGALALSDGSTLRIKPKIGEVNFFRLLFKAEGQLSELRREFEGFASYAVSETRSIDEVVAVSLMHSASEVLRRGAMFGRSAQRVRSSVAMGHLLPVDTIANIKAGKADPVVSKVRQRTFDIPENRLICKAVNIAHKYLTSDEKVQFSGVVNSYNRRFSGSKDWHADLQLVEENFSKGRYGGARGYYQKTLMLTFIVLGASGINSFGSDDVLGKSLLINTADVYEKYLRNVMREAYARKGYLVTKGGISDVSLYTSGSYSLEPDITVYKDEQIVLLCDAKYKEPTSSDHYQMHAYMRRFGVASGILLCPNFHEDSVTERVFVTPEKQVLREIHLPLTNLRVTEAALASLVHDYGC